MKRQIIHLDWALAGVTYPALKKIRDFKSYLKIRKKTLQKKVLHEGHAAQGVEEAAHHGDESYEEFDDHIGTHFKKI